MSKQKHHQTTQVQKGIRPLFLAMVFVVGFGGIGASLRHFSSAATASLTFYASPPTQTVTSGSNIVVQLRIKDPTAINIGYAKAAVTFPINLLQVTSISVTGSSFTTNETQTYSNTAGTITVARSGKTYVATATDFLLATLTFKSIAAGTASVAFTGGSTGSAIALKKGDTNQLTGSSGGTYTIQTPTPPPAQPPANTTPPTDPGNTDSTGDAPVDTTGDQATDDSGGDTTDTTDTTDTSGQDPDTTITLPSHTTTPKKDTVPTLTISHVQAIDITTAGATLQWQTNQPSSETIRYDANSHNYSLKLSVSGLETIHAVALHNLPAGSPVYYKITAKAKNGDTTTYSGQFSTAKPKSKTLTLVAASSGGGLGLVVLVLLVAHLLRQRKLPLAASENYGPPAGASPVDMSHAVAALALEQTTYPAPTQAVLAQQPAPTLQQTPNPLATSVQPQAQQPTSTPPETQQRATIEPIPRKVVTTERPTLHPAIPTTYTQPQNGEPVDMFQEGNQRLSNEGYPENPQKQ